jgi:phosphoribosylformylglycinamidine synthase
MVGLLEPWERHGVSHFTAPSQAIVLLGETREELGGSAWLALRRGLEAGLPPRVDLEHERRLHGLLRLAVREGLLVTAHDLSDGGFALALAECCFVGEADVGAEVRLESPLRPDALLFGESTGRVICAAPEAAPLLRAAREAGVPAREIGRTGGTRLRIAGRGAAPWVDVPVARLRAIFEGALPRRLEAGEAAAERGGRS